MTKDEKLIKKVNSNHDIGTIFSILNVNEARQYIGREVECCNNRNYNKENWTSGKFTAIYLNASYPFRVKHSCHSDLFHLIRLIPESFTTPEAKPAPGLIKALRLSIQQWQIMYDTGKGKIEVYKFLGGVHINTDCFLCYYIANKYKTCDECINWNADSCNNAGTCYRNWVNHLNSKSTLLVLNHLKSELIRLENT